MFFPGPADHAHRGAQQLSLSVRLEAEQPDGENKLLEEFSGVLPPGVVDQMYEIATQGDHDFLFIGIAGAEGVHVCNMFGQQLVYTP